LRQKRSRNTICGVVPKSAALQVVLAWLVPISFPRSRPSQGSGTNLRTTGARDWAQSGCSPKRASGYTNAWKRAVASSARSASPSAPRRCQSPLLGVTGPEPVQAREQMQAPRRSHMQEVGASRFRRQRGLGAQFVRGFEHDRRANRFASAAGRVCAPPPAKPSRQPHRLSPCDSGAGYAAIHSAETTNRQSPGRAAWTASVTT